jgi:hypothetical protein
MYRSVALVLICILIVPSVPAAAQDHVVSAAELRQALTAAAEKRRDNIKSIRELFETDTAKKSLNTGDLQKIDKAISVLDDQDLSRLASRAQTVQKEMVGGALSNQELTYIVIALAAAVLVLVLK